MLGSQMMEVPAAPRGASLVSVDGRTYPLESARVEATAAGGIACSTLHQVYRNPYVEPLEVVYTLPLPADGAVVGYSMRLGERVIRGEVRRRAEARAAFEKALLEGRSAALLEQDRDDTFKQRLGCLPAGQSAEITIEVLHPLAFLTGAGEEAAQWEYRFPTVVSVRYQGAAGRVVDAKRLDVNRADQGGSIPTRIELTLTTTEADGTTARRIEPMPLDRDLVIRFAAGEREIGAHLIEGPGLPGDGGRYGVVTITPPEVRVAEFARDLTILIDASGSMSGPPIEWAKGVAGSLLGSLKEGDRFEIITFANQPRSLMQGLAPFGAATLSTALAALRGVTAGGGTEMLDGVIAALTPLRPGSQHQVVLISDGQIGFEDEVVNRILESLPDGARLHVVGVGAAPNRTLTLRAARAGRGIEAFVCGNKEVQETAARLIAATARPVLTDLSLGGRAVCGIAPFRMRDVLAGQPVMVAVELAEAGGVLEVTGKLAGSDEPWRRRIDVPAVGARTGALAALPLGALYGREAVADAELSDTDADEWVTDIALRHRIASRMTSLVAISEEPSVDPRAPRRREELAVEVPAYQSAEALGLADTVKFRTASDLFLAAPAKSVGRVASWGLSDTLELEDGGPEVIDGRVISVQGDLIIVEFESPVDGFMGPDGGEVEISGEPVIGGSVVPELSSPRGPHARGLLLRVAVRRCGGWAKGDTVTVQWGDGEGFMIEAVVLEDLLA